VVVGNLIDFIRSDEAADRFQGVFLHMLKVPPQRPQPSLLSERCDARAQ
jgi:hypothetical protein